MHVEIKVAQNFVLNFLYNKLPRRRINLFGEELESALRDKFADHWYPDKPFKGSAFRCLKITDPADPVLNRAARESGNPVPDIVENLPTDLAIWIDPGEVSYRIGEKGSVKILYSESLDGSYLQNLQPLDEPSSPEAVAVASATAAAMAAAASFQPKNFNRPHGGHVGGPCGGGMHGGSNGSGPSQNFLPLDNLNLAVGGLTLNSNQPSPGSHPPPFEGPPSQMSPPQQQQQGQGPPELHHTEPPQLPMNVEPRGPGNAGPPVGPNPPGNSGTPPSGTNNGGGSSGGNQNGGGGFVPFQPRSHQPVIYTAGSFAQTKFGSTKLKSNAKKTNRMSPTEFSNYIKQRAMQKQGSLGSNNSNGVVQAGTPTNNGSGLMPIGGSAGGNNGSGAVAAAAAAAAAAVVNSNGGFRNPGSNYNNVTVNRPIAVNGSFHGGPHANGGVGQVPGGNLNYGGGSGRIPPHQHQSQDPYFYPLFPDRGQSNVGGVSNGSTNYYQNPQHGPQGHQGGLMSTGSSSESSSASSSSSSSSTTNPWSFVDGDAELFLQDILTVGLTSSGAGNGKTAGSTVPPRTSNGSGSGGTGSNLFNEYSSFNDLGNIGSNSLNSGSSSFGSNSSGGSTNSSGSGGSLGLSMLNNIGGLGSYGGNCATNGVGNAAGGGGSGGNGANQLVGSGPGLFNNLGLDIVDQALVNAATAAAAAAQQASNGGGGNGSDCGNTMGKIGSTVNNSFNMNPMGKSGSGVISKDGSSANQNSSGSACPEQQKYQQRVLVAN